MDLEWSQHAMNAATAIMEKLGDGRYPTVETACLCGSVPPKEQVVVKRDRYGIPHRMVMCDYCTLIRANPRMTDAAYQEFYNTEYRPLYDGFEHHERVDDDEFLYATQLHQGEGVHKFLHELDAIGTPKVVVEIGSYLGGGLTPWQKDGCTVYGVDIYAHGVTYAKEKFGIETVSSIDELIARGVKADLILMSDFIEHLTDPLKEIGKWKDLLSEKGRLFIYTPGLLAVSPSRAWQNAHTYQFIGATLDMVMRRMGYIPEFIDDRVLSLWRYNPGVIVPELPTEWRRFVIEHLMQVERRAIPPVWTQCKFTEKEMLENLDANLSYQHPHFDDVLRTKSGPCLIISGGPSIEGQLDKIKELQAQGCKVMVIDRMYPWATRHGITVDYVILLDASPGVEEGFTDLQADATHFIVATTHQNILPLLKGHKVYVWSAVAGVLEEALALWKKHGYKKLTVLNTGGSVALGATTLALMLGHRNLHIFGLDLMVPDKDHGYTTGIAGESVDRTYFNVEVGGETVLTCTAFLAFAQQFFSMMETARKWGVIDSVDVYGESIINKMWDKGMEDHCQKKEEVLAHG